ncbi:MAG: amidase family protein [Gammaproteobacteria bacterium]|nr:amidase family protein [Gammaproteobacteria bacterium]MDE0366906.1 amidase family protein [Gammaproteobacteria bacterium]
MNGTTDLCFLAAVELRRLLEAREVSALEVLDAHIARIEKYDGILNAIVTRCFEEARERATSGRLSGPLAGLPIAHKDLTETKGLRTTYGSPLFADNVPTEDSLLVARIKSSGAVTIGKTNTPEFGAGSQTFNRVFGATRNPFDASRTCGGSSGGAAVALAARFMPIADGSDTGGSLRNPAAFCNVVGFRPSPGRVPFGWQEHGAWTDLSTQGPMARSVDDLALLLSAIAGPDYRVTNALPDAGATFRSVAPAPLRGLRVAVTEDFGGLPVASAIRTTLRALGDTLADAGAIVTDAAPDLRDADRIFHVLRAAGFRSRFGPLPDDQKAELKETIRWNTEAGERLTHVDQDWVAGARSALVARVAGFFEEVDLLIGPTTQVQPFDIDTDWVREIEGQAMQTYIEWMQSCSRITVTCCPALSLPCGFAGGLPVGAQLIAPMRQDAFLLSAAKAVEAVAGSAAVAPDLDRIHR